MIKVKFHKQVNRIAVAYANLLFVTLILTSIGCKDSQTQQENLNAAQSTNATDPAMSQTASQVAASTKGAATKAFIPKSSEVMEKLGLNDLAIEEKQVDPKIAIANEKEENRKRNAVLDRQRRWIQAQELPREVWEVQYLGNKPVGYTHERTKGSAIGNDGILRIESSALMRISKAKEKLEQRLNLTSVEQFDGKLRSFEMEFIQGDKKEKTIGNVVLDRLRLQIEKNGGVQTRELPWRPEIGGPFAIMQSLRRRPMKPNETRELEMIDPLLGDVVAVTLVAGDYLSTPRLDGEQISMLEIRSTAVFDKQQQKTVLWVDEKGETQKSLASQIDIRSFRCEESMVARIRDAILIENKTSEPISLAGPTSGIESLPEVTFKITHTEGDAFRVIPQDEYQVLKSAAPFDITIRVERPPVLALDFNPLSEQKFLSDPSYRAGTPILQIDDMIIKRIADESLANESLGKNPVQRLVLGVGNWLATKTDFSPAMETASETARARRGSSNEHAILLAAVLRSQGIPSRVVTGLRFRPGSKPPALEYHAWTEFEYDKRWLAVDAMQPTGEVNSTYLRIAESAMSSFNPYEVMLQTFAVLPKLTFAIEGQK